MTFANKVKILNVVQFIDKYIKDKIADKVSHKFEHQVACYYGCLLVRPHKIIGFDRVEDPTSMDELLCSSSVPPHRLGIQNRMLRCILSIARTDLVETVGQHYERCCRPRCRSHHRGFP